MPGFPTPNLLNMRTLFAAGFAASLIGVAVDDAKAAESVPLKSEIIASGLDHPWSVEVLPSGSYLVSERSGQLRLIENGETSDPISGLPELYTAGQGGLLDLAVAPDFADSRMIYFTASIPLPGGQGTGLFSAKLSSDNTALEEVTKLFEMNKGTQTNRHFGSRIAIADDGSLFVTLGDRGEQDRAQDLGDYAGAVMHLQADGTPFPAETFPGGEGLPGLYSKGHRNPQGIDIDPETGQLITVEHGARGGDEVNLPEAGKNYGWPVISYGTHYSGAKIGVGTSEEGYEQPIHYWDPSIAPGALTVYRGEMFPEWDGDLLVAALKFQLISRLERNDDGEIGDEERLFENEFGRIRDIIVAPDGALLMVTDENNGALIRVSRGS